MNIQEIILRPETLFILSFVLFYLIYQLFKINVKLSNKYLSYPIKKFLPELTKILDKYDGTSFDKSEQEESISKSIEDDSNAIVTNNEKKETPLKKFGYP